MRAEPTIPRWQAILTTAAVIASLLVIGPASQAGPRSAGSAGAAGDAGSIGAVARMEPPAGSIPGIDVSHRQNAIDWDKVAGSGIRFAIAKATEGRSYIDPLFSTNRADAMAAGITFGAYHFARPDLHPFDPVPEADHFVDTAQLAPGNILPVLDLEAIGGPLPDPADRLGARSGSTG